MLTSNHCLKTNLFSKKILETQSQNKKLLKYIFSQGSLE